MGLGSGIRKKPIDSGSRGQKGSAPDPGSGSATLVRLLQEKFISSTGRQQVKKHPYKAVLRIRIRIRIRIHRIHMFVGLLDLDPDP